MSENEVELKKHTCPTCGGQLQVNLDKQMYDCPFCGVSFDYSYFREDDVLARAERFRLSEEWIAANDAYDFMLSKDPHNFCALRGKVLVAAHIRKGFDLKGNQVPMSQDVQANIEHALKASDEEHRVYFEKLQEYFEGIEKDNEAQTELDRLNEKYTKVDSHLNHLIDMSIQPLAVDYIVATIFVDGLSVVCLILMFCGAFGNGVFLMTLLIMLLMSVVMTIQVIQMISEKRALKRDRAKARLERDENQKQITSRQQAAKELKEHNRILKQEIYEMDKRFNVTLHITNTASTSSGTEEKLCSE